ncbi:hypothetical protein SEUCBS139899_006692 [Sporothrix eucalyptigena]|uniref:NADH dehydrogenase [ubiquinone] 1 alpha subcomplex assembly factor 3 n=1 Tax=Sporothrix eucalyptigena TaxID=1812306 RepID=A0ABP0BA65_9PEZI
MNCCSRALRACLRLSSRPSQSFLQTSAPLRRPSVTATSLPQTAGLRPCAAQFHSSTQARRQPPPRQVSGGSDGLNSASPPAAPRDATDLTSLDIFGDTPVPSTSVDICYPNGFKLDSGLQTLDGSGMLLVGGEAFVWRPWGAEKKLYNAKGQWEVDSSAFGLLGLVWPRPDLLILGLGPEIRPLSPETKRYITSLGMRVEVLDTRNAASQFNLLATERGVDDVAAALVPIGWKEGVGAS